jgi:aminopeptidase YwaD
LTLLCPMKTRPFLLILAICISSISFAQKSPLLEITEPYFELISPQFRGDIAYETVAYVEQYWRVAGNTGFNNTVYRIAEKLELAGYVLEEKASDSDRFTYRIEKRTMQRPTWEPVSASVKIIGEEELLLSSETNRNMVYQYSSSIPPGGISAEIIFLRDKEELTTTDVKGKILFVEGSYRAYEKGISEGGALGIFTYDNPSYLQPEKNSTSIQFRSLRYDAERPAWAIALSFESKERLKATLEKGPVSVQVQIETKIYDSEELTVVANVKGSELPLESLVFSAHIQEPGANDNATGVGTQLEMAMLTADFIKAKNLDLKRTLTFLWGDEIISTRRYIQEEEKRVPKINWGISLDMVGENTDVTGGTFLIEKMPDPSAIWTRGDDKHSEWGGRPLKLEDMKPHYFNNYIIEVFEAQGKNANWIVKTNPFEGGSDHTPFLQANIPGLLLWHFTDQFYHTDNDRLDKVSQSTMVNVGTAALVSAYVLLNADGKTAEKMLEMLVFEASKRLTIENELSKASIAAGGAAEEEQKIQDAWLEYYQKSMDTVKDLVPEGDLETTTKIQKAKEQLRSASSKLTATSLK